VWIDKTEQLERFCSELEGVPYITVDTEFMRVKTYRPILCLVQVGHGGNGAVIDVQAPGLSPAPLKKLLLDQSIVKVFHAASQDLEIFSYLLGEIPTPLFDTQIAAAFCGLGDQPGYAQLVQTLLRKTIDKSSQNTDWARRPLTSRQVEYALGDVTHLCAVYQELQKRLNDTGRSAWAQVDFEALGDPEKYRVDPRKAYLRVKMRRPKRDQLAILREVAAWREEQAMERDLPRHWVVKDDPLVEIALHAPRNEKELQRVKNLNLKSRDMGEILEAVEVARQLPESEWPELPVRGSKAKADDSLVALMQALLKLQCERAGIASRLVASRSDLEEIVLGQGESKALRGWRNDIFGEAAQSLLRGELGLSGNGTGGVKVLGDF